MTISDGDQVVQNDHHHDYHTGGHHYDHQVVRERFKKERREQMLLLPLQVRTSSKNKHFSFSSHVSQKKWKLGQVVAKKNYLKWSRYHPIWPINATVKDTFLCKVCWGKKREKKKTFPYFWLTRTYNVYNGIFVPIVFFS